MLKELKDVPSKKLVWCRYKETFFYYFHDVYNNYSLDQREHKGGAEIHKYSSQSFTNANVFVKYSSFPDFRL